MTVASIFVLPALLFIFSCSQPLSPITRQQTILVDSSASSTQQMTVPVINTASVYESLTSAPSSRDLLYRLKDVKNALIGNPLRKAEIVRSRELLALLTEYVHVEQEEVLDLTRLEILNEAAVILGSIANSSGDSVLESLLCVHLHTALLNTIYILTAPRDAELNSYTLTKALPSLVRALRNHLITIADFLWGWGSRPEPGNQIVLDTALDVEEDASMDIDVPVEETDRKGGDVTRVRARAALLSVYKTKSVNALLSLLTDTQFVKQPQIVLPLLQMLAQTTILPSQRMALYEWNRKSSPSRTPPEDDRNTTRARSTVRFSPLSAVVHEEASTSPLIDVLCAMVLGNGALGSKANSNFKLKQAGLDLLTVLVKERTAALEAMSVLQEYGGNVGRPAVWATDPSESEDNQLRIMTDLLESRVPGIGISAAACLVSFRVITSQDPLSRKMPSEAWRSQPSTSLISGPSILNHLSQFMESAQSPDDRIKACYLTARLVQDDVDLQRKATETNVIARCVEIVKVGDREQQSPDGKDQSVANAPSTTFGPVVARRMVEAGLTAIATLCTFHEPAKQKAISLGVLPLLNRALQSPAYATRTAACQVARVLSRSIAILRTTLVDSGVAKNVVGLLRTEEQLYAANGGYEKDVKRRLPTTSTVLSAATATICNLICEFSPMQTTFMAQDGIQTLVRLTDASDREVRINSIWALRNMVFKSEEDLRKKVVDTLGWETLRRHLLDSQPEVAEQALAFTRNLIAEASEAEITRLFEGVGEEALFEAIESAMSGINRVNMSSDGDGAVGRPDYTGAESHLQASDRLEQALFVLYNIALGNEHHREAILKRPNVLAGMRHALYITESPLIKIPAIGGFINLVETNDRHRRTRQEVINRLRPYLLPVQVRALCSDQSFDVRDKAGKLLAILEVGMYTSGTGSATA